MPPKKKQPQDHRPKQTGDDVAVFSPTPVNTYTFTWEDTEYHLPAAASAVDKVSGRALRDAYMDGEAGQMRLALTMLELVDADPGALDALYDMPGPVMLQHIAAWMEVEPVEGEPGLGESLR